MLLGLATPVSSPRFVTGSLYWAFRELTRGHLHYPVRTNVACQRDGTAVLSRPAIYETCSLGRAWAPTTPTLVPQAPQSTLAGEISMFYSSGMRRGWSPLLLS